MAHLSSLLDRLPSWAKRLVPGPRNPGQEANALNDIPVQEQGPRCISPAFSDYAPGIVLLPSPPPSFATSRPVPGYLEQPFSANETPPITKEHTKAFVGDGNVKDMSGYTCCLPINRRFV